MTAWTRWRLAIPLICFSGIFLLAASGGVIAYWSIDSTVARILTLGICFLFAVALAASVTIGVRPTPDTPWTLILVVVAAMALGWLVEWMLYQLTLT